MCKTNLCAGIGQNYRSARKTRAQYDILIDLLFCSIILYYVNFFKSVLVVHLYKIKKCINIYTCIFYILNFLSLKKLIVKNTFIFIIYDFCKIKSCIFDRALFVNYKYVYCIYLEVFFMNRNILFNKRLHVHLLLQFYYFYRVISYMIYFHNNTKKKKECTSHKKLI